MLSCTRPDPSAGSLHPPSTEPSPFLAFSGIQSASWDGGSGLSATWNAAEAEAAVTYTLEVLSGGEGFETVQTGSLEAALSGLPDGEYDLRVVATADGRSEDGGTTLHLYIGENRLLYRSNLYLPGSADVWGAGDIAVVAGYRDASFYVVDVSDPAAPELLTTVTDGGLVVKDVKIADGLLFTQAECACPEDSPEAAAYDGIGLRIFDFADPSNPILLAEMGDPITTIHNVAYGDGYLYLSDPKSAAMRVVDVRDPSHPVERTPWHPAEGSIVHDQVWVDGTVYVATWTGFSILDASDPENLVALATVDGREHLHNVWPSADGDTVFATEERLGGELLAFDVSNLADVTLIGAYGPTPTTSVHNVSIRDEVAYLSYYQAGLHILDVSDPTGMVRIGRFDTYDFQDHPWTGTNDSGLLHTHPEALFTGTWGVWPYGEHVLASDTEHGLFVFDLAPTTVTAERP